MEVVVRNNNQDYLPDTIEDLTEFVLIGKEILKVHEAKIRAIKSVDMADKVKKIAYEDAHSAGKIVISAEGRLGELLAERDRSSLERTPVGTLKQDPDLPPNISKKLSHEAQTISNNPEKVARIISKAKEEGKIPTPASVYRKIKDSDEQSKMK